MRALYILLLLVCVHCKMVDLDCALTNPLHCQTLFESGDNSFSHQACNHLLVPVVLAYLGPAPGPVTVVPPAALSESHVAPFVLPPQAFRRPPPALLS